MCNWSTTLGSHIAFRDAAHPNLGITPATPFSRTLLDSEDPTVPVKWLVRTETGAMAALIWRWHFLLQEKLLRQQIPGSYEYTLEAIVDHIHPAT